MKSIYIKAMKNTYTLDASAMIHLAFMTRTHTNSFRITSLCLKRLILYRCRKL